MHCVTTFERDLRKSLLSLFSPFCSSHRGLTCDGLGERGYRNPGCSWMMHKRTQKLRFLCERNDIKSGKMIYLVWHVPEVWSSHQNAHPQCGSWGGWMLRYLFMPLSNCNPLTLSNPTTWAKGRPLFGHGTPLMVSHWSAMVGLTERVQATSAIVFCLLHHLYNWETKATVYTNTTPSKCLFRVSQACCKGAEIIAVLNYNHHTIWLQREGKPVCAYCACKTLCSCMWCVY
jgi:hypothetical protein